MRLKEILNGIEMFSPLPFKDVEISGITSHSKQVKDGFLFIAVPGTKFDGRDFIAEAIGRGAKVVVSDIVDLDNPLFKKKGIIFIQAKNIQESLAKIAVNFYHHPSQRSNVFGITGTNGKTTTTYLIENVLKTAGSRPGVIGTVNYRFGQRVIPASNTTPGVIQLQELLYHMVMENVDWVVMEVSSHALAQKRVRGIDFKGAIFTNLGMDHLDYHQNMENYFNAKAMLFENLAPSSWALINMDDVYGRKMLLRTEARTITYAIDGVADVEAREISSQVCGSRFLTITPHGRIEINTALIGRHNIYNILAAVSFGISQNIGLDLIKQGIESLISVPGRLETIDLGQSFKVFVDYAHTDDALKNILTSIRNIYRGRIILVFGCGGDRCRDKRPLMGRVASELADHVILTTDNPRSEEPEAIIKEIEQGFLRGFTDFQIILDRYAAIKQAICLAHEDDVVIIAGKGHEAYQIFKNTTIPFDDRFVARQILLEQKSPRANENAVCGIK
jgi:UDP-N-acetylmuramyl-tripeptide synthetase